MKNSIQKLTIVVLGLFFAFTTTAQDKILTNAEIPGPIKTYVSEHFPDEKISYAELEWDGLTQKYEINLSLGTSLEFDKQHKIIAAESNKELPSSVIPTKLSEYVKSNYPESYIKEWKFEKNKHEVELNNGLDLTFNNKFEFLRIDD